MKIFGIIAAIALLVGGVTAGAFHWEVGGLNWDQCFGTETSVTVDEGVSESTPPEVSIKFYTEAERRQLVQYRLDYMLSKDPYDQAAIVSAVHLMFRGYNDITLQPELRKWLKYIENKDEPISSLPADFNNRTTWW